MMRSKVYLRGALALGLACLGAQVSAQNVVGAALNGAAQITGAALGGAAQITGAALGGAADVTGTALGGAAHVTEAAVGGAAQVTGSALGGAAQVTDRALRTPREVYEPQRPGRDERRRLRARRGARAQEQLASPPSRDRRPEPGMARHGHWDRYQDER